MSETYETGRCVIGDRPHAAAVGYLCRGHLERLGSMLREIEDEAALLEPVPSFQQQTGTRGGSLASHRAPARIDVLVHTDRRRGTGTPLSGEPDPTGWDETPSILDVLGSWARIVREERRLTADGPATITSERRVLTVQLEWIAAQEWCDEFYGEIRTLLGHLKAANGTGVDKPYATCPVIVDGQPCAGQVWVRDEQQAVWRRYPDRCSRSFEDAPGAAVCDTCGAVWADDAAKARLKRMVADMAAELARPTTVDGRPMFTAAELAEKHGMSVAAVRMRLSRVGARAVRGSYYDPAMVTRETA